MRAALWGVFLIACLLALECLRFLWYGIKWRSWDAFSTGLMTTALSGVIAWMTWYVLHP